MQDKALAEHVLQVHSQGRGPAEAEGRRLLPPEVLRGYIARAKETQTHVPPELAGAGCCCRSVRHTMPDTCGPDNVCCLGLWSGTPVSQVLTSVL